MLGRSCRSRGVCDGVLYINTGDDEATFLRKIRLLDYNRVLDYIELLKAVLNLSKAHPKVYQGKQKSGAQVKSPIAPEIEAIYQAWTEGKYFKTDKELKAAVAEVKQKKEESN